MRVRLSKPIPLSDATLLLERVNGSDCRGMICLKCRTKERYLESEFAMSGG